VLLGRLQDFTQVRGIAVQGAGHKAGVATQGKGEGIKGMIKAAQGAGLGVFALLAGRGILTFGEAVNFIIEKQYVDVYIAPEQVGQVITPYAQAIAIAGDHPYTQVWIGHFQPGSHGRRPSVDAVHAVGVHVVGKAGTTTDARDENDVFPGDAQLGEHLLHLGEDAIVATAGTPFYFLIAGEIFCLVCCRRRFSHYLAF
jgi:hypothetical protein